jgi:hypothetical protein
VQRGRIADVRWVVSEYGFDGVREFFRAGAHPEISGSIWPVARRSRSTCIIGFHAICTSSAASPRSTWSAARAELVKLPNVEVISITDAALMIRLEQVPVDVVRYPYPLLQATSEGPAPFPIAGLLDLATMKLSAAARRGIRRDFWDLYEIFSSGALTLTEALGRASQYHGT